MTNADKIQMIADASTELYARASELEKIALEETMVRLSNGKFPHTVSFTDDESNASVVNMVGFSTDFRLFPKQLTIKEKLFNGEPIYSISIDGVDDNGISYEGLDSNEMHNGDWIVLYNAIKDKQVNED